MLLSAETALEIERQKNRDIAFEKQSNLIEDSNVVEKTIEMTEECSNKKHLEIQASLNFFKCPKFAKCNLYFRRTFHQKTLMSQMNPR